MNKLKWVLGISLVFLLILATNLIDKNSFVKVRESIVSIYDDQMMAKEVLFDLSMNVHEKRIAIVSKDSSFFRKRNNAVNDTIHAAIGRLDRLNLDRVERGKLSEFNKDFLDILALEEKAKTGAISYDSLFRDQSMIQKSDELILDLKNLQNSQMRKGKRQSAIGKRAVGTVELLSKMEMYLLIALAIIIQAIVLYTPNKKKEGSTDS